MSTSNPISQVIHYNYHPESLVSRASAGGLSKNGNGHGVTWPNSQHSTVFISVCSISAYLEEDRATVQQEGMHCILTAPCINQCLQGAASHMQQDRLMQVT